MSFKFNHVVKGDIPKTNTKVSKENNTEVDKNVSISKKIIKKNYKKQIKQVNIVLFIKKKWMKIFIFLKKKWKYYYK